MSCVPEKSLAEGRDPFNQNFRKFRLETEWIGSVQPEKFRKMWSTFRGGPIFWLDRSDRKFAVPFNKLRFALPSMC